MYIKTGELIKWWLPVHQLLCCVGFLRFAGSSAQQQQQQLTRNNTQNTIKTGRVGLLPQPPFSNTSHPGDSLADWLLIDSGSSDLLTEEAKHSKVLFAETGASYSSPKQHKSSTKRKHSSQQPATNKTEHNNNIDRSSESPSSSDPNELYDDPEEASAGNAGSAKEPECASHNRYYCTYKEDYPLKLVTEVTKYYKWPLEKLFRDLHAQIMPKLAHDSSGNLVCDSITRVVRPGWTRNTNDKWLVVINTENYHQYVTEVVCQYGSNSRCNFIPPCYYSSCQQRYNTQKLLVIDPANPYRGPFLSEFLFPSCCVCYVPSASDPYQDKYRSSPASIYQRTMQQEAASNLYPPKFGPIGFLNPADQNAGEAPTSQVGGGAEQPSASSIVAGIELALQQQQQQQQQQQSASGKQQVPPGPLGPGELRRIGEQYSSKPRGGKYSQEGQFAPDFPRLGMSDTGSG